uniref:Uncharacterized protein n=1 Tax=Bactrocera latifrons TaxID=174628 RepID=A0A0K8VGH0_BACLA
MNCKYKYNDQSKVIEMDTNHIYVINAKNKTIYHNCNSNNFTINGNYLIRFENCNIQIDNLFYRHRKPLTMKLLPNPVKVINITITKNLSMEETHFQNIKNIQEIKELRYEAKKKVK